MTFGSQLDDGGKEEAAVGRSLLQTSRDGETTEGRGGGVLSVTSDLDVLLPVRRTCGCFYCLCSVTQPHTGPQQAEGEKKAAVRAVEARQNLPL